MDIKVIFLVHHFDLDRILGIQKEVIVSRVEIVERFFPEAFEKKNEYRIEKKGLRKACHIN